MTTLSLPLTLYFKSFLSATVGSAAAEKVFRYSLRSTEYRELNNNNEERTELDYDLAHFFYPSLGIFRGLVSSGFAEEEAGELVFAMWEFAPAGFKERPWANSHIAPDNSLFG